MTWGNLKRRAKKRLNEVRMAARSNLPIHAERLSRLREQYLRNTSVKALVLRDAGRKRRDLRTAMGMAERMDLFARHRGAIPFEFEPKSFGRFRITVSLPPRLRVAQTLAKNLIHAQHEPGKHIYDWPDRGGCLGAVEAFRDAIDNHGKYVVVADICDAHGSFNPDYLYSMHLLPPELVGCALDSRRLRYRRKGPLPSSPDITEQTRPGGLLQGGAASSAIFAVALDDLPQHLPGDVVPIVQSDNILIVCRSKVECEAAADALGRYLRDNPAGAFTPRMDLFWMRDPLCSDDPEAVSWPHSFEQLGYLFFLDSEGRCKSIQSMSNALKIGRRIQDFWAALPDWQPPIDDHPTFIRRMFAGLPATSPDQFELFEGLFEHYYREHCEKEREYRRAQGQSANDEDELAPWND